MRRQPEPAGGEAGRSAGRLIMTGVEDGSLSPAICDALEAGEIGGLILFRRDLASLDACAELIERARALAPHRILIAIDEEGGFVSQIDGLPLERTPAMGGALRARGAPSPASLGEIDDELLTRDAFEAVGSVLRAIGFDLAFAPLADVNVRPDNPVIGRRSFGSDPALVTRHVLAALDGLRGAGVHGCVKHFPGHGAASVDSHLLLPTIEGEVAEIPVFQAAFEAGVPVVMTAHAHYPALDPEPGPATRSSVILQGLLRGRMGFAGVVVSDALEMKGFDGGTSDRAEAARAALAAGIDLFLVTRDLDRARDLRCALEDAARRDPAARARLEEALRRVEGFTAVERPAADAGRIRAAVVAAAPVLRGAHERSTRPMRPPMTVRGNGRVAVLLPVSAPAAYLDASEIERALSGPEWTIVVARYGESAPPVDRSCAGVSSALCVFFVRGATLPPEARAIATELEAWRAQASGRTVVALWAADHLDRGQLPPAWGAIGLSGSHASAFEAASVLLGS